MQCSLRIFWNLKTDALHFEGFLRGQAVHTQRYAINGQQRVWPVRFCSIGYVIWQCPGQRGFIKTWLGCLLQLRKRRWMETVERLTTSSAADEHTKVLHKMCYFRRPQKEIIVVLDAWTLQLSELSPNWTLSAVKDAPTSALYWRNPSWPLVLLTRFLAFNFFHRYLQWRLRSRMKSTWKLILWNSSQTVSCETI